jgi:hypothetical protein
MEAEERIRRAGEAKRLLSDPLMKEARATVDQKLVAELSKAEITPERIARLQSLLAMGNLYWKYLERAMNDGAKAADEIEAIKRERTFLERWRAIGAN